MVAQSLNAAQETSHIRPFILHRDLETLADLIEMGFGKELAQTGSRMVDEMRQMAGWGVALYPLRFILPFFRGYVWVENEKLVGNASLVPEGNGTFALNNVVVQPEYRGRGIAGHLVERAIADVRQRGGRRITLQVHIDNAIARALYAHRGFETYDTVQEMSLSSTSWPVVLESPRKSIRSLHRKAHKNVRQIMLANITEKARPYQNIRGRKPRQGILGTVRDALTMAFKVQDRVELVAVSKGRVVGLVTITVHFLGRYHEMALYVLPDHRGQVERDLIETAFHRMSALPRREIRCTVSTSHPEALEVLQRMGFQTQRILDQMGILL